MDEMDRQWTVQEGDDVYGSDDAKLGSVSAVEPDAIIVKKGFLFSTDYSIPMSAITNYDQGNVYLGVTKDQAMKGEWGSAVDDMASGASLFGDEGRVATSGLADDMAVTDDLTVQAENPRTTTTDDLAAGETLRVPVHEETLAATTRPREIGQVRIEKDVIAEEQTLEVPITEERIRVTRHAVDLPSDEMELEEGVIEVSIRSEDVQLEKRVRVTEEIEIGKEAVQRTEQVGDTIRREEVRITQDIQDDRLDLDRDDPDDKDR
jgi:uncharacterized protein (TIGR02271 family)